MSSLMDCIDALLENENLSPLDDDYLEQLQQIINTLQLPADIVSDNPLAIKARLRDTILQLLDQILVNDSSAATTADASGYLPLELLDLKTDASHLSIIIACKLLGVIQDEHLVTRNTRQIARDLVSALMESEQQHSQDCFIQASRLIKLFRLTILDAAPSFYRNSIIYLDHFIIRKRCIRLPCNLIRLILASNDHSWIRYLEPYPKRSALHAIMLHIATEKFADTAAVREVSLLDKDFQVIKPEADTDAAQLAHEVLREGASLGLFNNFSAEMLRQVWEHNIPTNSPACKLFNSRMLAVGRVPVELGIECVADDPQLIDIARQLNPEALAAMHTLVNTHRFELPDNIAWLYKQHVSMLLAHPDLCCSALFLLGLIHQEGDAGIGINPNFLASAGFYAAAIDRYQHTKSMVNLGYMIESGLVDANNGIPDYTGAENLYLKATKLNDPLAYCRYRALKDKLHNPGRTPVDRALRC